MKIIYCLLMLLLGVQFISCSDDDCTKTQVLYGNQQLGGNRVIEVPCDFPEPEPITPTI
ncbi:hypothetical protein [Flagellimonas myxillae]|uniref:hypothetical protein n=1 Tax=Flagellimonas myxillae TaxID=2942214 RepID=UPI00201F1004|nr:hypothetical protein [Muricauda myxillae]MCL6266938.1 hypothetical protein [Muricauda myxillae]